MKTPDLAEKKIKEGFVGQKMVVLPTYVVQYLKNGKINVDFQITAIGFYPKAAYHDRQRPNGCEEYILIYCIDGEGQVEVDNSIYDLSPNSFFFIPPHQAHHYRSSTENPWSIYWVHFKGRVADGLFQKFIARKGLHTGTIAFSENHVENFMKAIDLCNDRFSLDQIEYSSLLIKNFIVHLIYTEICEIIHPEEDRVENALAYMKSNLDQEIKIHDLSSRFHLSVSRFSELFKERTGYSPIQYLILIRIQKACQLLHFTDLSVKEISTKVGFEDQYYFSRMFKKIMGLSPIKYRQEYHK